MLILKLLQMRKYISYKVDRHISLRKKSNRETILCLYLEPYN